MKHYFISIIFLFGFVVKTTSQTTGQNYIVAITPTSKVLNSSALNSSNSTTQIQYFDGLGRPIETVQKGITPSGKDLVSCTEYDGVGREWKHWLPKTNNGGGAYVDPTTFKSMSEPLYGGDAKPFSETVYEPSPLNRIKEQFGAGQDWKNSNKRTTADYGANAAGEVKYFYADGNNQLTASNSYAENTLYKTISADEDGKQAIEYKDKLGRVVMKRSGADVDTYFVYNDLGQLAYVLPPLSADSLGNNTYNENTGNVKRFCYVYKYDDRGNCIYKKLPGCEPIYMIYDNADRLILSQDGNQRAKITKQWTINKYDIFGRILYTGVINREISPSEKEIVNNNIIIESCGTLNQFGNTGYTCNTFINEIQPLTVNYYDNYNFLSNLPSTIQSKLKYIQPTTFSKAYPESATDISELNAKGLLTGARIYMLDGSGNYTVSANYYDDKARVVQSRSTNHLGGYDIVYNKLDFTGKPNKTLKEHNIVSDGELQPTFPEIYTYEYDNAGRLLKTKYQLNNNPEVTLTDMTTDGYDELGRLKTKKRHNGADTESFNYNIRGWTTKITSGNFEEELNYQSIINPLSEACYNGNISSSTWTYNGQKKTYIYKYDELSRLKSGTAYNTSGSTLTSPSNQEQFTYDKQGNITSLARQKDNITIDAMYNIGYNGNQIQYVNDYSGSQNQYSVKEYQDKSNATIDFSYDANGNLIKDLDRDIVTIKYNILNLPEIIQFKNANSIYNYYDASGKKLKMEYRYAIWNWEVPMGGIADEQSTYGSDKSGIMYVDNIEYEFSQDDGQPLEIYSYNIYNSEGYVTTTGQFFYYRKDHLGNNREVWCANTGQTVQRTQYYPSGLPWAESTGASAQNKKYNGKEFVEAHGLDEYDSAARWYYPAIMRTTTVDPHAERYPSISPYAYVANNPIMFIDPDGRDIVLPKGTSTKDTYTILGNLQKLTNDKLVYSTQKDGTIRIKIASLGEGNKTAGTRLIRRLNSSDQTMTIQIASAGSGNSEVDVNSTNATNGKGTDVNVYFDPTSNPDIMTEDPKTGNVSGKKRPNQVGLAHEMIHGERSMRGEAIDYDERGTQTYKDASGKTVTEPVRKEEAATSGVKYHTKKDITENQIRKEQGQNKRGAY